MHHVLIVDDEPEVLSTLCDVVEAGGFKATGAPGAREAMEVVKAGDVHLVITDLMMPDINGWQLLRALKRMDEDLPVVVLTGYIPEHGETILTDRNADGYLTKPVSHEELLTLIRSLLKGGRPDRKLNVVVLDDDASALATLEHVLTRDGMDVVPFQDIGQALEHVRKDPPDLVSVDLMIPHGSGFDLVEAIREDPKLANLPILIVTAEPSKENVQRAISLRVNGFISKPFEPRSLGEKVRKLLRQAGLHVEGGAADFV